MGIEWWIGALGSEWMDPVGALPALWGAGGLLILLLAGYESSQAGGRTLEALLEESEERWRRLVEEHPEPIYVTVNGCIRYINPSGLSIFGADSVDELMGAEVMSFVHPDVRDTMRDRLAQLNRGEETEPLEHRMIRRDGEERIVVTRTVPIRYEGQAAGQTVIRDVTEQRRAEEAVKKSEYLLDETLRQMPAGVVIVDAPSGRLVRYNEEAQRLLGHEALPVDGVLDYGKYAAHHPDGTPYNSEEYPIARALSGETVTNEEMRYQRPGDGGMAILSVSAAPIRDDAGRILRAVSTFQDITARKQIEDELGNSKALYEALTRSYPLGAIVVFDHDLRYLLAGGQELETVGLSADQMIGKTIWEVFPAETCALIESDYRKVLRGEPVRSEVPYEGEVYVNCDVPVYDDAGDIIAGMVVTMNITQLKEAEAELKRANQLLKHTQRITKTGGWVYDPSTETVAWTAEMRRIHDVGPDFTPTPATAFSFCLPRWRPVAERAIERAIERQAEFTVELEIMTAQQRRRWIEVRGEPDVQAGRVARVVGTARDITRQKSRLERLRLLDAAVEHAHDMVIVTEAQPIDEPGPRIVYVNEAFEEQTGYTRGEAIGRTPRMLQGEDTDREALGRIRAALERAEPAREEVLNYRKDGTPYWIDLSIVPVTTGDGAPTHYLSVQRNITERKEAEQALVAAKEEAEELAQRNEMALLGADLGFWDLDFNTWTNVVNERWAEMLGYTLDEVGDTQDFFEEHTHPDDLRRAYEAMDRHARGEIPMIDLEIRMRAKDGTWRWIQDRGKIMEWNDDGSPRRAVGTHLDITERKRRASIERRFGRLLDASAEEIYVFDAESLRFTQVSRGGQKDLGRSMDSLRTMTPLDIKPFDRPTFAELLRPLRTGRQGQVQFETTHRRADGSTYPVEVRLQLSQQEEPPVFLAVVQDITARKRRERELVAAKEEAEEMNRLKTAFLANMSHEIRTPLTAIIGFADVLSSQVDSEAVELLDLIRESGRRLEMTLTSVLDLAQLESHTMSLSPEWTDVGDLVRDVATLFRTQAESRGIGLVVDTPPKRVKAYLDATALQRILTNIVSNAIKFTEQGSVQVRVRAAPGADAVRIAVEDTGIGIPADQLDTIFTEFAQVSQGYTRDYEGSGLGLTISQELVELLGGTIEIESTEGEGSVVTVQVPRHAPGTAPAETEAPQRESPPTATARSARVERPPKAPTPQPAPVPDGPRTVLLVEDNALTRDVLPLLIEESGAPFTIEAAATAGEALDKASETTYDLFLIDINLGSEMTGVDVMNRLRGDARYASAPMIACTAYAMPGDEERLLAAGFDAYLAKPFRKDELLDAMNEALRRAGPS